MRGKKIPGKKILGVMALLALPLCATSTRGDTLDIGATGLTLTSGPSVLHSGDTNYDYQATGGSIDAGGTDYSSLSNFFDFDFDVTPTGFVDGYTLTIDYGGNSITNSYTAPAGSPLTVYPMGGSGNPLSVAAVYLPGLPNPEDYAIIKAGTGTIYSDLNPGDIQMDVNFMSASPLPKGSYGAMALLAGIFGIRVMRQRQSAVSQVGEIA